MHLAANWWSWGHSITVRKKIFLSLSSKRRHRQRISLRRYSLVITEHRLELWSNTHVQLWQRSQVCEGCKRGPRGATRFRRRGNSSTGLTQTMRTLSSWDVCTERFSFSGWWFGHIPGNKRLRSNEQRHCATNAQVSAATSITLIVIALSKCAAQSRIFGQSVTGSSKQPCAANVERSRFRPVCSRTRSTPVQTCSMWQTFLSLWFLISMSPAIAARDDVAQVQDYRSVWPTAVEGEARFAHVYGLQRSARRWLQCTFKLHMVNGKW